MSDRQNFRMRWEMPTTRGRLPRKLPHIEEEAAFSNGKEISMRFAPKKGMVVAGILAAAVCGLLITTVLPASTAAPMASVAAGEATVSPFAMMMKAPRDLPSEQYDAI
jgi:hypothetical protein